VRTGSVLSLTIVFSLFKNQKPQRCSTTDQIPDFGPPGVFIYNNFRSGSQGIFYSDYPEKHGPGSNNGIRFQGLSHMPKSIYGRRAIS
jgi:hypothetical protein